MESAIHPDLTAPGLAYSSSEANRASNRGRAKEVDLERGGGAPNERCRTDFPTGEAVRMGESFTTAVAIDKSRDDAV